MEVARCFKRSKIPPIQGGLQIRPFPFQGGGTSLESACLVAGLLYPCRWWSSMVSGGDGKHRGLVGQEIDSLSHIQHENVIRLVGYADEDEYYGLVYEIAKRDLEKYKPSDKIELDRLLLGAAKGLHAIHSSGFIHWDFQARNLLLMKDGTVKVADFGLCTKKNEKMVFFGDRRVGKHNSNDTEEAQEKYDVFCFGSLMRELVLMEKEVWTPTKCPRQVLADACWVNEPDKRPLMEEIVAKLEHIHDDCIQSEPRNKAKASSSSRSTSFMKSFLPRKKSK